VAEKLSAERWELKIRHTDAEQKVAKGTKGLSANDANWREWEHRTSASTLKIESRKDEQGTFNRQFSLIGADEDGGAAAQRPEEEDRG